MIKNIFITFTFLFSFNALSCELELPSHILKLKENLEAKELNTKTNCDESKIQNILNKISQVEGKVLTQTLASSDLKISPRFIEVVSLNTLLNEELLAGRGDLRFFQARSLMNKSFLSSNSKTELNCSNCDSPGEKRINLRGDDYRLVIVTATIKRKASYLVATRDITPFDNNLSFSDFITLTDFIDAKTTPFAIDERVEFFKSSRFIKKGQIVENNMLLSKTLIQMGSKVTVFFKSDDVSIKSAAIARKAGKYGDYIELINPNSNKKITAKIIDFNKAIVDL